MWTINCVNPKCSFQQAKRSKCNDLILSFSISWKFTSFDRMRCPQIPFGKMGCCAKQRKKIPAIGKTEMDTLRIMIKIFLKDQLSKLSKLTQCLYWTLGHLYYFFSREIVTPIKCRRPHIHTF